MIRIRTVYISFLSLFTYKYSLYSSQLRISLSLKIKAIRVFWFSLSLSFLNSVLLFIKVSFSSLPKFNSLFSYLCALIYLILNRKILHDFRVLCGFFFLFLVWNWRFLIVWLLWFCIRLGVFLFDFRVCLTLLFCSW